MTISFSRVYQKSTMVIALMALMLVPTLVPEPVHAEDGFFASAVKGISNMFSFGEDDTVVAEDSKTFPVATEKKPTRTILAVMTAYSSDPNQTDGTPCIPADWKYDLCEHYEKYGEQDTIAANFLPMGTKVRFPDLYGDKVFTVRDRMNSRYGVGRGDIWMPTYTEAKNFGVKKVTMEIFSR